MGERKHKAEGREKKGSSKPGTRGSPRVVHPILQLQQLVGNKAVTNMIQRDFTDEDLNQHNFWVDRLGDDTGGHWKNFGQLRVLGGRRGQEE